MAMFLEEKILYELDNGVFNENAFNTLSQISNKYSQELEKLTVSTQ